MLYIFSTLIYERSSKCYFACTKGHQWFHEYINFCKRKPTHDMGNEKIVVNLK